MPRSTGDKLTAENAGSAGENQVPKVVQIPTFDSGQICLVQIQRHPQTLRGRPHDRRKSLNSCIRLILGAEGFWF